MLLTSPRENPACAATGIGATIGAAQTPIKKRQPPSFEDPAQAFVPHLFEGIFLGGGDVDELELGVDVGQQLRRPLLVHQLVLKGQREAHRVVPRVTMHSGRPSGGTITANR